MAKVITQNGKVVKLNNGAITANDPNPIKSGFGYDITTNTGYLFNVSVIPSSAFTAKDSMISLVGHEKATRIEYRAFNSAFNYQTVAYSSITFPEVSYVGGAAFERCGLRNIIMPKCTSTSNYAFAHCSGIYASGFPNLEYIADGCFQNDGSIDPSFPKASYVGAGAFSSCYWLGRLSLPNCTYIGTSAFRNCHYFTMSSQKNSMVYLPKCSYIGYEAMNGLGYYSAMSSWYTGVYCLPALESAGGYAFLSAGVKIMYAPKLKYNPSYGCFSRMSLCSQIYVPQLTSCYYGTFNSCYKLQEIYLPNVSFISQSAFCNCSKLSAIYLLSNSVVNLSNSNAFISSPMNYSSYLGTFGSIYIPESLYESYCSATNWVFWSSRFATMTEEEIAQMSITQKEKFSQFSAYDPDW